MQKDKFNPEEEEVLKLFQTAENRCAEEIFSQFVTERNDVRLFFINEDQAYTDGKNIIVDPAADHAFSDRKALQKVEEYLELDSEFSSDMWSALAMITRGQNLHECLHILLTKFPSYLTDIKRFDTKPKQFAVRSIENIIEDAFIENAAATLYDNISLYLKFNRVLDLASTIEHEGTLSKLYKEIVGSEIPEPEQNKSEASKENKDEEKNVGEQNNADDGTAVSVNVLFAFLHYIALYAIYPFVQLKEPPAEIEKYFEKSRPFIDEAIMCGNSKKRAECCSEIYEIIKELIPEGEKIPEDIQLEKLIGGGGKTHKENYNSNCENVNEPQEIEIKVPLFERVRGSRGGKAVPEQSAGMTTSDDPTAQPGRTEKNSVHLTSHEIDELKKFLCEQNDSHAKACVSITVVPVIEEIDASKIDVTGIHKGIKIRQIKPATDRKLEAPYKSICSEYGLAINKWSGRCATILRGRREEVEDKLYFGSSLSSSCFGDLKKRYWEKTVSSDGLPDLGVMIMIDGSGSMSGERQKAAVNSCVILHEVLKRENIPHCIVDYSAIYGEDEVVHNILLDFNARKKDCCNILTFDPDEGTRDGISLLWAEKYFYKNCDCECRLIIVISDGMPNHSADEAADYIDDVAVIDSALCVKKIFRRGIKIVGIALDEDEGEGNDSFEALKQIYPDSIKCTDLNKLPGQLLEIIAKQLQSSI